MIAPQLTEVAASPTPPEKFSPSAPCGERFPRRVIVRHP